MRFILFISTILERPVIWGSSVGQRFRKNFFLFTQVYLFFWNQNNNKNELKF